MCIRDRSKSKAESVAPDVQMDTARSPVFDTSVDTSCGILSPNDRIRRHSVAAAALMNNQHITVAPTAASTNIPSGRGRSKSVVEITMPGSGVDARANANADADAGLRHHHHHHHHRADDAGPSPAPKKIGFFKSLFGHKKGEQEQQKREKDKEEEHEGDRRSPSPGYVSRNSIRRERTATISAESPPPLQYAAPPSCNDTVVPLTRSKTESEVYYENHPQSYIHTHIPTHHSPGEGQTDGCSPTDGGAGSCGGSRPDPRLMDFLRYYKSKDYKLAAFREGNFLQSTPSSPLKSCLLYTSR